MLEPEALRISGEFPTQTQLSITRSHSLRDQVNRYMLDAILDTMPLKCEKRQQVTQGSLKYLLKTLKSMIRTEGCRSAEKGQVCQMPTGKQAFPTPCSGQMAGGFFLLWWKECLGHTHTALWEVSWPSLQRTSACVPGFIIYHPCHTGCLSKGKHMITTSFK